MARSTAARFSEGRHDSKTGSAASVAARIDSLPSRREATTVSKLGGGAVGAVVAPASRSWVRCSSAISRMDLGL